MKCLCGCQNFKEIEVVSQEGFNAGVISVFGEKLNLYVCEECGTVKVKLQPLKQEKRMKYLIPILFWTYANGVLELHNTDKPNVVPATFDGINYEDRKPTNDQS